MKGTQARTQIIEGARITAEAAAVTYGPQGRNVILQRQAGLLATKDGATVVREIVLPDRALNLGAQLVKQASLVLDKEVGDGTTSACVLTQALLKETLKHLSGDTHPRQLVEELEEAAALALETLPSMTRSLSTQEELFDLSMVASKGDEEIAKLLAEAFMTAGEYGHVVVEDSASVESSIEIKDGLLVDAEYPHPEMWRSNKYVDLFDLCIVVVIQGTLDSAEELIQIVEDSNPRHPLVIFAHEVTADAFPIYYANKDPDDRAPFTFVRVRYSNDREGVMEDLCAAAGCSPYRPDMDTFNADFYGTAQSIEVSEEGVVFVAFEDDEINAKIDERIGILRSQADDTVHTYDQDRLRKRAATLDGGMVKLLVGGVTEAASKERRARVEDALSGVQVGLRHGVVAGGAWAYWRMADPNPDTAGARCLSKALQSLLRRMSQNCGIDYPEVILALEQCGEDDWKGYDVITKSVRDFWTVSPRVTDPVYLVEKVVKTAVSVVVTLIMCEVAVVEEVTREEERSSRSRAPGQRSPVRRLPAKRAR